ncbi:zinc finger dhhc domain-containing protein [Cyclospora cayetanensis]|uniref:Zinc finger dhhc domain-containing protein n=1 Tax=Cyclospora cayetanensis TaxID=88456 RepID=A0A1D3CUL8_9EIME|nr:zinc finger dhhc domain-containing protein [Cyclospora cayetanensis]
MNSLRPFPMSLSAAGDAADSDEGKGGDAPRRVAALEVSSAAQEASFMEESCRGGGPSGALCVGLLLLLLRCGILGALIAPCPSHFSLSDAMGVLTWIASAAAVVAYFLAARTDPGVLRYCPSLLLPPELRQQLRPHSSRSSMRGRLAAAEEDSSAGSVSSNCDSEDCLTAAGIGTAAASLMAERNSCPVFQPAHHAHRWERQRKQKARGICRFSIRTPKHHYVSVCGIPVEVQGASLRQMYLQCNNVLHFNSSSSSKTVRKFSQRRLARRAAAAGRAAVGKPVDVELVAVAPTVRGEVGAGRSAVHAVDVAAEAACGEAVAAPPLDLESALPDSPQPQALLQLNLGEPTEAVEIVDKSTDAGNTAAAFPFSIIKRRLCQYGVRLRFCERCCMYQMLEAGVCTAQAVRLLLLPMDVKSEWGGMLCMLVVMNFFVLIGLFLMVGCLAGYHALLMSLNLTTWEQLAWGRISYLKRFEEAKGSPFSRGFLHNLQIYWRPALPKLCRRRAGHEAEGPLGEIWWRLSSPHLPFCLNGPCCRCVLAPAIKGVVEVLYNCFGLSRGLQHAL